jgi:hypothetical protein
MKPDFDRRGSKNSFLPSSTMAGSLSLASGIGWMGSSVAGPGQGDAGDEKVDVYIESPLAKSRQAEIFAHVICCQCLPGHIGIAAEGLGTPALPTCEVVFNCRPHSLLGVLAP